MAGEILELEMRRQHVTNEQSFTRHSIVNMADKVAGVPLAKTVEQTVNNGAKAAPKAAEGNPAFRMMGMRYLNHPLQQAEKAENRSKRSRMKMNKRLMSDCQQASLTSKPNSRPAIG